MSHRRPASPGRFIGGVVIALLGFSVRPSQGDPMWRFVDVTAPAGLTLMHGYTAGKATTDQQKLAGGVAAGDYDKDGFVDLYVVTSQKGRNLLFHNQGDGTFVDVAQSAGVAIDGVKGAGPLFFDYDGDGWLDLLVGAIENDPGKLFRNLGNGTFADVTASSGLVFPESTVTATAGDYDGDGWLDLFLSHWGSEPGSCHLWHNTGTGQFTCVDRPAGLPGVVSGTYDFTFTSNFVDINGDRLPDLLVAADYGDSTVWLNRGKGRFDNVTSAVITDENGMGATVGDYDGDGRLDWFISSIFDADVKKGAAWGKSGNRLYRSLGDGTFEDATDAAGVRDGNWGWGSSFADFNNDGWLDLVVVNGMPQIGRFTDSPSKLFIANGKGRLEERAVDFGFDDHDDGRGVISFDYDRDGDLDVFVMNNNGPSRLWRNDGASTAGKFLFVSVVGRAHNPFGVGATVFVTAGGRTQTQLVRDGSNYASQDPLELHFGLGDASRVERIRVLWPDGTEATLDDVEANQRVVVTPPPAPSPSPDPTMPPGPMTHSSGGGCSG